MVCMVKGGGGGALAIRAARKRERREAASALRIHVKVLQRRRIVASVSGVRKLWREVSELLWAVRCNC